VDDNAQYEAYLGELRTEFSGFDVRRKSARISQRFIGTLLRGLTVGQNTSYMKSVVTTLGDRVYVPDAWFEWSPLERLIILRHEAVHIRQFRRLSWPGMALVYLFLPLPFVFAGGRAWLELEAYKETLTATWELKGSEAAQSRQLHDAIVARFTGSDYGWMWIRGTTIRRALEKHISDLQKEKRPCF
jgi:hypothetical protein